jgi:ankyrin repeat protein
LSILIGKKTMMMDRIISLFIIGVLIAAGSGCKSRNDRNTKPPTGEVAAVKPAAPVPAISIHDAALNGRAGDVAALLKAGISPDTLDQEGRTPLIYAAFNGNTEIMSTLIRNGADVNKADNYGRTPLMMAASGPYPLAVKMLLDQKADPNLVDKEEHFTALMYAAAEGQLEVVKILLSYKADPNLKDIDGDDALTFARNNGHKAVVAQLESIKK